MAKQSKSQRIRELLKQNKTVKEIAKAVKCHPGLVYQVRSYDKAKNKKAMVKKWKSGVTVTSGTSAMKNAQKRMQNEWVMVETLTSKKPIGIPKDVYYEHMQPKDYPMPKRNIVQRFFNWLCGG